MGYCVVIVKSYDSFLVLGISIRYKGDNMPEEIVIISDGGDSCLKCENFHASDIDIWCNYMVDGFIIGSGEELNIIEERCNQFIPQEEDA